MLLSAMKANRFLLLILVIIAPYIQDVRARGIQKYVLIFYGKSLNIV
jgi:hypothetical protein